MQTRSSENRVSFFRSMQTTLLGCFFVLSLIPMTIVGIRDYQIADNALRQEAENKLEAVLKLKQNALGRLFRTWRTDILASGRSTVPDDFADLCIAFRSMEPEELRRLYLGKADLAMAGDGSAYSAIHEAIHRFYTPYLKVRGYGDVLLVNPEGNVVYSARKTGVFGSNLVSGPFRDTNLAVLCRQLRAKPAGEPLMADAGFFEGEVALFVGAAVYRGDVSIGSVVFRVPFSRINQIMLERKGMGRSGETYLVGPDKRMRSDSFNDPDGRSVRASFEGTVAANGVDTRATRNALAGKRETAVVRDYRGIDVMSASAPLKVENLTWAIMAEVDLAEALDTALGLRKDLAGFLAVTGMLVVLVALLVARWMVNPIRQVTEWAQRVGTGDLTVVEIGAPRNEIGLLTDSFKDAVASLKGSREERERQDWLKTGQASLDDVMRGDYGLAELARNIVTFVARYVHAQVGALYVADDEGAYRLTAGYAFTVRKNLASRFRPGEGLVGQAALEKQPILLTQVPEDYVAVTSGLGEMRPRHLLAVPMVYNKATVGVCELGKLEEFTGIEMAWLETLSERLGIVVSTVKARAELKKVLEVTQLQARDLAAQQEELRATNEELEEQTRQLQASEEELKSQQEELQVTNEELEEKTQALEEQKQQVDEKNTVLKSIQRDLEKKARELAVSSQYKSEFLANMSHELRTPLNSLLILAQDLTGNKKGNLSPEQVESAAIIHSSGVSLLNLINDILDLSKIEAGMMELSVESVRLADITDAIRTGFRPLLEGKGLAFETRVDERLPEAIVTDRQRLHQILTNLVANALKFTEKGTISVSIERPGPQDLSRENLEPEASIAISVTDTGIGIPPEKQTSIFEAFQQGDGSVSRRYGGTGLGLSICRELARLLGGEIRLKSRPGAGSTFTLNLPEAFAADAPGTEQKAPPPVDIPPPSGPAMARILPPVPGIADDRESIGPSDRTILVVEDDLNFSRILYRMCHEQGYRCIHAADGTEGIALAGSYRPDAVILDLHLPGVEGWGVLESLKRDPNTRHIPVHIMSVEKETIDAYRKGAMGYLTKPVSEQSLQEAFDRIKTNLERKLKRLLIVEDDTVSRKTLVNLIGNGDVTTTAVGTGQEALAEMGRETYDCVILDLNLPDMSGFEVLDRMEKNPQDAVPPIIVYTGRDLSREEEYRLQQHASSIIVKGVRSHERLLDETALFLHRVIDNLPDQKKRMISRLYEENTAFEGKKVLVVDDDMRNVFALSKVLEDRGVTVFRAADGEKAMNWLDQEPDMHLVLMDVMMPVMDGYETIRRIRQKEGFRTLPIIAVTAKAMKHDRDRCMEAGANDYLPKPVDIDRLLSLMRVWLYK